MVVSKRRFAIIGAGPAGLAAAQQVREVAGSIPHEIVVYERNASVGGVWTYVPDPGPCVIHTPHRPQPSEAGYATASADPNILKCPSAMYDGLRTNVPSPVMAFRGFPFARDTPMFPSRAQVWDYLTDFAQMHGLLDCIRFQTEVVRARRLDGEWHITSKSRDGTVEHTDAFDYLIAAHGRCNAPYVPAVPGLHHFRGRQMHSAWYRYPDALPARRILIVGNNSSGSDIARELCGGAVRQVAPRSDVCVYQSFQDVTKPPILDYDPRDLSSPAWSRRIHVVGPIDHVDSNGALVFSDGTRLDDIELIVWATGFLYDVPFFHSEDAPFNTSPLLVRDDHTHTAPSVHAASSLHGLDDWMLFYKAEPSLAFIGLPNNIVPFPLSQVQARAAAHVWFGKIPPLGRVRAHLNTDQPERWVPDPENTGPEPSVWGSFTLGPDAEAAYTDALLSLMPASTQDWAPFPAWRRHLRKDAVKKRRELLGY